MVIANRWTQIPWNPLRDLQEVQREFARLLGESRAPQKAFAPQSAASTAAPLELHSGSDGALVRAALPGFASDDIEISVERDALTITSRSCQSPNERQENEKRSSYAPFQRTLRLPFRIDAENTFATMKDGLLEVRLSKAVEDSPKKIEVRTTQLAAGNGLADPTHEEN